jgi:L-galactose dehydrogenase
MRKGEPNKAMEYRKLGRTDLRLSILGFGTGPLGDLYGRIDPAESKRAVHLAIERGINFFDSSPYYGKTLSEERLGEALVEKRDKVVLATKCGRYGLDDFDFSAKRITASIDESLKRLRTDYVDLFQAHDVEFGDFRQIVDDTVPALQKIRQRGKARYVGITGYPPRFLARIAEQAPVDSILNYCHYDLLATNMDDHLTPFAMGKGIGLINASALHMGILTEGDPPPWHPAPPEVKAAGRKATKVCAQHGTNISKVSIRFSLDHPHVSSTLVGMATEQEVRDNLAVLEEQSDPGLLKEIRSAIGTSFNIEWPSGNPANND